MTGLARLIPAVDYRQGASVPFQIVLYSSCLRGLAVEDGAGGREADGERFQQHNREGEMIPTAAKTMFEIPW